MRAECLHAQSSRMPKVGAILCKLQGTSSPSGPRVTNSASHSHVFFQKGLCIKNHPKKRYTESEVHSLVTACSV